MVSSIPELMISSSDGPRPIPLIGMGTATEGVHLVKAGIIEAIKVGYRHFDTAAFYQTENVVGEAIKEAFKLGLIKRREDFFHYHQALVNLGLEYVDLYLIHYPLKLNQDEIKIPIPIPIPKGCIFPINIKDVWKAMEECQNMGLTKSIGVSNITPKRIQEILSFAKIPPAINQVEMNPVWQQKKLNEFCKKNGILLTGYSPLGASGNEWGHNRVMESHVLQHIANSKGKTTAQVEMNPVWQQKKLNEFCKKNGILLTGYSPLGASGNEWGHNRVMESHVLQHIANSKGKTTAQISLRWIYEQGVSFVIKSFNSERMKQNLDIFDWSLTEEELNQISHIPQQKHTFLSSMASKPNDVMLEIDAELSLQ